MFDNLKELLPLVQGTGAFVARLPVHVRNPGVLSGHEDAGKVVHFFRDQVVPLLRRADQVLLVGLKNVDSQDMNGEGAVLLSLLTPVEAGYRLNVGTSDLERLEVFPTRSFRRRWVLAPDGGPRVRADTALGDLIVLFADARGASVQFLMHGTHFAVDPGGIRQLRSHSKSAIDVWLRAHPAGLGMIVNPADVACYLGREARASVPAELFGEVAAQATATGAYVPGGSEAGDVNGSVPSLSSFLKSFGRPLGG